MQMTSCSSMKPADMHAFFNFVNVLSSSRSTGLHGIVFNRFEQQVINHLAMIYFSMNYIIKFLKNYCFSAFGTILKLMVSKSANCFNYLPCFNVIIPYLNTIN